MPKYSRLKPGHILAQRWFAKVGLDAHADAYIRYLTDRGYAPRTAECYFRSVAHFVHWTSERHVAFHDADDALIDHFLYRHLPHCQCASQCRKASADIRAAVKHFLDMLGIARATPAPIRVAGGDPNAARRDRYHRRSKAVITRLSATASTSLPTITRQPPDRTITIRPPLGRAGGSSGGGDWVSPTGAARGLSGATIAGTNPGSSSSPTSLPSRACRRQLNIWLVESPWRRAVAETTRGALKLSATIRCFSSSVQRRRDPVSITSSVETFGIGV